jgi:hypothetical protein
MISAINYDYFLTQEILVMERCCVFLEPRTEFLSVV